MNRVKRSIKLLLRTLSDVFSGTYFRFAERVKMPSVFAHSFKIIQEIKPSPTFGNKVYNLTLASQKISGYVLLPGQVFSFWNIIGNPERGFKKGRSIINGQLSEETGGGLCQVSGIIYHAALLGGLEVLERHNHSIDIYTNETRFTPLGTDATVVYGYKDLRVRNNLGFPVRFNLGVSGNSISVQLQSAEKIQQETLSFQTEDGENTLHVMVRDGNGKVLNQSKYRKI